MKLSIFHKAAIGIILLVGLLITLILASRQQDIRQKAAETPSITLPLRMPVLVIAYYPPDPLNPTLLDGEETGWKGNNWGGKTIEWWKARTQEHINHIIPHINDSTRFRGYKNPNAPAFLKYEVEDTKIFNEKVPRGVQLWWGARAHRPHHGQILRNVNICDYVDRRGVKEVWLYIYHSDKIEPDESKLSSKYGDVSNALPKDEGIPEEFRMPRCSNSYTLFSGGYQPDPYGQGFLHTRIHQFENIIPYIDNKLFWEDFSEYVQTTTVHNYKSSCGNAHYAPNWRYSSGDQNDDYDYNLTNYAENNCETWHPDDSKTTYVNTNCSQWGCSELGFYKWFIQSMPGYNNGIVYNGQKMRNWWEAVYDFNAFVDRGRTLYGESIFTPIPTSTPHVSVPPTLNIAFGKQTFSNRTSQTNREPAKAVDGDTSTPERTWTVDNPIRPGDYWQVDLGQLYQVGKIIIYPNTTNHADWLNGYIIQISTTGSFTGEQQIILTETNTPHIAAITYTITPITARYIRIVSTVTQDWVQLQEVEVYGSSIQIPTAQPTHLHPTPTPTIKIATPTPARTPTATPKPTATNVPTNTLVIQKPGDTNNDKIVNIQDYNILVTQFNKSGSGLTADFNASGKVDVQDYNILVTNFGK